MTTSMPTARTARPATLLGQSMPRIPTAGKIRAWADATEVPAAPLLECLAALEQGSPEQVAAAVWEGGDLHGAQRSGVARAPG